VEGIRASAGDPAARVRSLIAVKRYEDAIVEANLGLASDPQASELVGLVAQSYIGLGRAQDALLAADRYAGMAPTDEWGQRLRSVAFRKLGRKKDALAAANESVRLAPGSTGAHLVLIDALLANGDSNRASGEVQELRRLAPAAAETFNASGRLQIQMKRWADAEADFREALRLNPNESTYHNNLAIALRHLGKSQESIDAFHAAVRTDPRDNISRANLYQQVRRIGVGGVGLALILAIRAAVTLHLFGNRNFVALVAAAALVLVAGVLLIRGILRKRSLDTEVRAFYEFEQKRQRWAYLPYASFRLGGMVLIFAILFGLLVIRADYLLVLADMVAASAWYFRSRWLWERLRKLRQTALTRRSEQ
jgi:tetratricopeptide (TPR) repeat protein